MSGNHRGAAITTRRRLLESFNSLVLHGAEGDKVEQLLISILDSHLPKGARSNQASVKVVAIELAVVPLALIRAWLKGTVRCTGAEMARHIAEASANMRKELQ